MAHKEQKNYLEKVKKKFPEAFKNNKVLDIGSFDVNGNEEPWFEDCEFIGLDIGPGKGVDVVCPANEYDAPDNSFDTINSSKDWVTMPNVFREDWDSEYYRNVTEKDVRECVDVDEIFSSYEFEVETNHCDLYFWGIKKIKNS